MRRWSAIEDAFENEIKSLFACSRRWAKSPIGVTGSSLGNKTRKNRNREGRIGERENRRLMIEAGFECYSSRARRDLA
jgi:hypothetical protein